MGRIIFSISLLVVLAGNVWAQTTVSASKNAYPIGRDIILYPIADGIYVHESYVSIASWGRVAANGLVVISNGVALLIDTPWTDSLTVALTDWLLQNMHVKVEKAVGCHFHDDCIGGFDALNKLGVETIYGEKTRTICSSADFPIAKTTFSDSLALDLNGLAIHLYFPGGGHSKDNIVVYIPSRKVLFGGCLIKAMDSNSLGNTADADIPAWPFSVQRVIAQFPDAVIVVPGHGKAGGKELLQHTIDVVSGQ